MLDFSENIAGNPELITRSTRALTNLCIREFNIGDLQNYRRLYVFSAHANRGSQVYLSNEVPAVEDLAGLVRTEYDLDVAVGEFDIAQENWIALRRDFHLENPAWASEVLVTSWLQLNNLIRW